VSGFRQPASSMLCGLVCPGCRWSVAVVVACRDERCLNPTTGMHSWAIQSQNEATMCQPTRREGTHYLTSCPDCTAGLWADEAIEPSHG